MDLSKLTLYNMMAENLYLTIKRSGKRDYDLIIENEENEVIINETEINAMAMASMAEFCMKFLEKFLIPHDEIIREEYEEAIENGKTHSEAVTDTINNIQKSS